MINELRHQLRDAVRPLALEYGLATLPGIVDIVVIAWLFFTGLQYSLSPAMCKVVFPVSYGKASKRTRRNWDVHVVSLVHAFVVVVLASRCLIANSLDDDRAFGSNPDSDFLLAIAMGYFIWDSLDSIIHFSDAGFVLHGTACLTIYVLATRPFVNYYAVRFLLWEASTIFLNVNWFLDKMGKSGSQLQLINGIALLSTFFAVRLIWGGKISYEFFVTFNTVYTQLPLAYIIVFGAGNLTLQGLNWFWFLKMITALRKRFEGGAAEDKSNAYSVHNGNGTSKAKSRLD